MSDLLPGGYGAYVVEDGRALAEGDSLFDLLDKGDAAEVHKVVGLTPEGALAVDGVWGVTTVVLDKLTCPEEKGKVLVVVETPNAMGTRRLQNVDKLDLPHQGKVTLEDTIDYRLELVRSVKTKLQKAKKEDHKV